MKYAIGIDLGGTNIAAGLLDEEYRILRKISIPTRAPRPAQEIVSDMAGLVRSLSDACGVKVDHIGIGSPGIIADGVVKYANNLRFENVPLARMMEDAAGLPCALGNDANAAALGEYTAGAARGASSFIMITLGTGVGGGIVQNGKIVEGFNGAGGEIGHFVLNPAGHMCGCGKRGCFEAHCSASALIRDTKAAMVQHPESALWKVVGGDLDAVSGKTAFDAMRAGDEVGRAIVDRYIYDLGLGISNLIAIFQPEIIALGGGIAKEGEGLLAPLRDIVYPLAYYDAATPRTKIVAARLGGDAGIVGAAALGS